MIIFFNLAEIFRKCGSRFAPRVKLNYSALTTTNCLTLPSQFVVFKRKNQCLLEKGIQAKIHV